MLAWNQIMQLYSKGDEQAARRACHALLQLQPNHLGALNLLAQEYASEGNLTLAFSFLQKALDSQPNNANLWCNAAQLHANSKNWTKAQAFYERAIGINPKLIMAHVGLAESWVAQQQWELALKKYEWLRQLLVHDANHKFTKQLNWIDLSLSKARIYINLCQWSCALELLDEIVKKNPENAEAHLLRAHTDLYCGKEYDAIRQYHSWLDRFASASTTQSCENAYYHLTVAYHRSGQLTKALAVLEQLHTLSPTFPFIEGWLLHVQAQLAIWDNRQEKVQHLLKRVALGEYASQPFQLLAICDDPALQMVAADLFVQFESHKLGLDPKYLAQKPLIMDSKPNSIDLEKSKIVIAYVSADFYTHATSILMADLFESHSRQSFRWIGYGLTSSKPEPMANRIESAFDEFFDVHDLTDAEVVEHMKSQGVDIVVDLKGHTQNARPRIFMLSPAPIVVNYLVYPGTMGQLEGRAFHNYLIADEVVIPPGFDQFYRESIVRMPHSYQCNDRQRVIADYPKHRSQVGLPDDAIVLCCFNSTYKITPEIFAAWMTILQSSPNTVLWLLVERDETSRNAVISALKNTAIQYGVSADRIIFSPRTTHEEYLARMQLADIFVDTYPCNAHTTASDALWSGLPVVTLSGRTFASRVAASLLKAVDLSECITNNLDQYVQLIFKAVNDYEWLQSIRKKLTQNKLSKPLFDTLSYAQHLESAYRIMHRRHQEGLAPASFFVPK